KNPGVRSIALAAVLLARDSHGPTKNTLRNWRNAGKSSTSLALLSGEQTIAVDVAADDDSTFRVTTGGESRDIRVLALDDDRVRFLSGGIEQSARIAFDRDTLHLSF